MGNDGVLMREQIVMNDEQYNNVSQEISLFYSVLVVIIVVSLLYALFRKEPVRKENNNV